PQCNELCINRNFFFQFSSPVSLISLKSIYNYFTKVFVLMEGYPLKLLKNTLKVLLFHFKEQFIAYLTLKTVHKVKFINFNIKNNIITKIFITKKPLSY